MDGGKVEVVAEAESVDTQQNTVSAGRRQRKYRYKRSGHHRHEKDNARRKEARTFLSGITLDTFKTRTTTAAEFGELEVTILTGTSPSTVLKKSNASMQVMEDVLVTSRFQPVEQRLHEIAADLFDLPKHLPLKQSSFRSQEHNLEHTLPNYSSPIVRSSSLFDSSVTHTPNYEQHKRILQQMGHSSLGLGGGVESGCSVVRPTYSSVERADSTGVIHYCGSNMRWSLDNCRSTILMCSDSGVSYEHGSWE